MVPFFLTCKYTMQFIIQTLVDITETKARRNDNEKEFSQQSNYNTCIQTVSLRANVLPIKQDNEFININKMGFGSAYRNKHHVWSVTFDNEYDGSISLDLLMEDFSYIPILTGLNETIKFKIPVFITKDIEFRNIIFSFSK